MIPILILFINYEIYTYEKCKKFIFLLILFKLFRDLMIFYDVINVHMLQMSKKPFVGLHPSTSLNYPWEVPLQSRNLVYTYSPIDVVYKPIMFILFFTDTLVEIHIFIHPSTSTIHPSTSSIHPSCLFYSQILWLVSLPQCIGLY